MSETYHAGWQRRLYEEQCAAEDDASAAVRRAIETICAHAEPTMRWGGDIDCDWIEVALSKALDEAFPQRIEQRCPRPASNKRKPMSLRTRTAVLERDLYRCVTCGTHENLSVDHIHPRVLGGTDDLENLQTLCRSCNSAKGARV